MPIEVADRYFQLPPGGTCLARFMSGVFPVRVLVAGQTRVLKRASPLAKPKEQVV